MRVWLCGGRESGTEREREKEEGREGERVGTERERGKRRRKGFAITLLNRPRLVQHPEAAESPVEADASDDKMRLSLRPRFQSRHTADNIDTASGIPKVENSWLDVASLVMSSGQAPT